MKREGIEYEERMELLEEVTWPKPLDELLTAAYEAYAAEQPWVLDFTLSPKASVRDVYERAMTFGDFVRFLPADPLRGTRAPVPVRRPTAPCARPSPRNSARPSSTT